MHLSDRAILNYLKFVYSPLSVFVAICCKYCLPKDIQKQIRLCGLSDA